MIKATIPESIDLITYYNGMFYSNTYRNGMIMVAHDKNHVRIFGSSELVAVNKLPNKEVFNIDLFNDFGDLD